MNRTIIILLACCFSFTLFSQKNYKYITKHKKSEKDEYYLEIQPSSEKYFNAKSKHGKIIDDRDIFVGYSYHQKIEILQELLTFCGDTTRSCKKYKIREDAIISFEIQPFTTQIEALYTFSRVLMLAFPSIKPQLTDKRGRKNYNNDQKAIDEVYGIYRTWLKKEKKSRFENFELPMSGTKYKWNGQEKLSNKWFINFHYIKD